MMKLEAIVARFPDLEVAELTAWVELGWVRPAREAADWQFDGVDQARVGLIYDLRRRLGVQEDTVPMVLSLLDQVYALRATLKAVGAAIDRQPAEVRDAVRAALTEADAP
ncbi:hypothetical protein GCM10011611_18330 [Aliidongia dinghuensis]|uniref:Chaperone modulatory protein CbpM n=1 Tax=Aliidongia dinghuensis TaxID=1867774 RepID=A0A8J2YS61_9PROT|nr:chaperone modulator CbpM [Aliidongia dinghuensis]GGF12973.1 hypothetical protein GCM10011611_18330 [Aliidongia dinghuensis]